MRLQPVLAAAGLALASQAHAAKIVEPNWLRKPTAEQVAFNYPALPSTFGVEGRVWLRCEVAIDGSAQNCAVKSETPTGLGFGTAALNMAATFAFTPQFVDGKPTSGGKVTLPINFNTQPVKYGPRPADPALLVMTDVDPKTAALARRLVALASANDFVKGPDDFMHRVAAQKAVQGDPAARERLIQAFQDAYVAERKAINDQRVALAAHLFTAAQLSEILRFLDSDAGKAYFANIGLIGQQSIVFLDEHIAETAAAALKTYCAEPGACPDPKSMEH
jgi:TonB family protein